MCCQKQNRYSGDVLITSVSEHLNVVHAKLRFALAIQFIARINIASIWSDRRALNSDIFQSKWVAILMFARLKTYPFHGDRFLLLRYRNRVNRFEVINRNLKDSCHSGSNMVPNPLSFQKSWIPRKLCSMFLVDTINYCAV
jgi:hypothetical protein